MKTDDVFGHDPHVIYLRQVFSRCEKMQEDLLGRLRISKADSRLRELRRIALSYFEKLLPIAMRKGVIESEEDAGTFYLHCFAKALRTKNISVSPDMLSPNEKMLSVLKEMLG